MNKFFWIAAGASLGIGAYIILNGNTSASYASDYDTDDASDDLRSGARRFSRKASNWGTGQRVSGTIGEMGGRLKEGFGNVTGDDQVANEGVADQVVGAVKDTAGRAAHAVSDTVNDLTR
jgi:uncharacterized protein YjbJ (UPF0337 family)